MRLMCLIIVFACLTAHSQEQGNEMFSTKQLIISYSAEASHSFYGYNQKDIGNRFPVPEFRLGSTLEKEIAKSFYFKSGIHLGVKLQSRQYFMPGVITTQTPFASSVLWIDEVMSFKNHYFVEIPLLLLFKIEKIKVGSGLSGRLYMPNSEPGHRDFIAAHSEIGNLTTLSYQITKKFTLGLQYYFAINPIFDGGSVEYNGTLLPRFRAKNKFVGLSAEYRIR